MLFYHFFCVAFYSIWILLSQGKPDARGEITKKRSLSEVPGLMLFSVKVVSVVSLFPFRL